MSIIQKQYEITTSAENVYNALLDADIIQTWSGDEASMEATVGGEFSLWGGQMTGTNTELVKNKRIIQEWIFDKWEKPSKVTITIKKDGDTNCIVDLLHEDVPATSQNTFADGWDEHYFGAIQRLFEIKK